MNDGLKFSFEVIVESSKQVITLSTGLVALGIVFAADFATDTSPWSRGLLALSWVPLLISMALGLATLGAVSGVLGKSSDSAPADPYARNIRLFAGIQMVCFMLGLLLSIFAGICILW